MISVGPPTISGGIPIYAPILPDRETMAYLLQQKLEDLELWLAFRDRWGHLNILINSINSDLAVLGRSDQSIPEVPWGEF